MNNNYKVFRIVCICACLLISSGLFVDSTYAFSNIKKEKIESDELLTREKRAFFENKKIEDEKMLQEQMPKIREEIAAFESENQNTTYGVTYGGFRYLDGDILITNKKISRYYTGHAGIVVGDNVLEITPKANNGHPRSLSMNSWFSTYPSNMVIRQKNRNRIPVKAAWYGKTFYIDGAGRDNIYSIASGLYDSNRDYCSSLVWKCYHNAGLDFKVQQPKTLQWLVPDFITPYNYITYRVGNGFSAVHSVNW